MLLFYLWRGKEGRMKERRMKDEKKQAPAYAAMGLFDF
jgi:hypothetical protein